ncbi:hypothetical protein CLI64_26985 [Nostoc sp. CENA543]|uniref:COG1470 family protein n=1 Tax=Nostoc sp. CENA543 TaxID=1869241 RepID=UPI000CA35688|nr:hypothetical protein [Nostoc sp. CENA543]AUT03744.1 hypothetical protein CLI64_26985 [Nostoc sp. CENA543]
MTLTNSRNKNSKLGLSMADILTLPTQQRKLVQWMLKNKPDGATLAEAAYHLDLNQQATLNILDELLDQDFIQTVLTHDDDLKYRVYLAPKQGIQQETIQQVLAPGSPLAIIFNPSGDYAVQAGSRFEIHITVTNKGAESALINVFIDDLSPQLIQWCDAPHQRLALSPNSIGEVLFEFNVPITAIPSTYNYVIVVDAPEHYPEDTPIRHTAKLQVLPAIETVVRVSDPTFNVIPASSSRSPAPIPPGGILQLSVNVHNRSDRVDRFRLSCSDCGDNWYTIRYPEGLETAGLIIPNMGLNLNPGETGQILLQFHPPLGVTAGIYYPTLRLYSANNPDLVLLDVVYVQVLPSYLLNAELLTVVGRVRRKAGVFEIRLTNAGNTVREIVCTPVPADEDKICTYVTTPPVLRVLPGEKAISQVTITPVRWWSRPIFGAGRLLNFRIELVDQQQFPLPNPSLPGTVIWEARPWWQLLLFILTVLGSIAAIAFLLWLLLKPPASPKIVRFQSSDASYQQANNGNIRLNWQIRYPKTLQTLTITGVFADGSVAVQPVVYNFNGKIPTELQSYCQLQNTLTCANIPTDARKPGDYIFELQAFSSKNPEEAVDTIKTNTIKIIPIPPAKILEFAAVKPTYQEVPATLKTGKQISADTIRLNWKVSDLDKINQIQIIGRSPEGVVNSELQTYQFNQGEIPDTLQPFCRNEQNQLTCRSVPTKNSTIGNYIFELQVFAKTDTDKPSISQKTDVIKVQPLPSQIVEFKINGSEPLPKYQIPIDTQSQAKQAINFSWKVEGSSEMTTELLPAPGNIPRSGTIVYPINNQPGSETIILQATSPTGEKISRSVTIETFALPIQTPNPNQPQLPQLPTTQPTPPVIPPPPTAQNQPNTPGNTPGSPSSAPLPTSPTPSQPGKLSPLELPPGFD